MSSKKHISYEKYQDLKENFSIQNNDLKEIIFNLQKDFDDLKNICDHIKTDNDILKKKIYTLKKENKETYDRINDLKTDIKFKDEKIISLKDIISKLERDNERIQKEIIDSNHWYRKNHNFKELVKE